MKVLLVNKAYFPHLGGVETVVRQVAEGMHGRGHEVIVLCFGDRSVTERIDGVEVRRVRPLGHIGSAPVGFRFVAEFFKLSKWADVINFHSPNPMGEIALLFCPSLCGKKIICTYHGDAQKPKSLLPVYDAMLRRFFRRCGAVAVSSPPLAENSRVLKDGSVKEKIRIIPLGVRTENYENHQPSDLEKAKCLLASLPPSSFKVMYAGRMVYYKGIGVLLDALRTLLEPSARIRADCPPLQDGTSGRPISAFLVGSGPEEDEVKTFIAKNSLGGDVLVVSPQPEAVYRALLSLADCFVLPSTHKTEAYGIVLVEAMASGLPVVSTELGTGTSWVNLDGETGVVVPPGDPDALARAIAGLADNGGERLSVTTARMAAAARVRVKNFFEEETMLEAYDEAFRAALSRADAKKHGLHGLKENQHVERK